MIKEDINTFISVLERVMGWKINLKDFPPINNKKDATTFLLSFLEVVDKRKTELKQVITEQQKKEVISLVNTLLNRWRENVNH